MVLILIWVAKEPSHAEDQLIFCCCIPFIIQQCRFDSQPAVIIVEELQEFSKREKQVLIYTLLDLMHREDLLFVVSSS